MDRIASLSLTLHLIWLAMGVSFSLSLDSDLPTYLSTYRKEYE